jgi:glucokinase
MAEQQMRQIVTADIGGTHARFAVASIAAGKVVALDEALTLKTGEHASFRTAWEVFAATRGGTLPPELALAFAGPVGGETLKLTNNPWLIRPALMNAELGIERSVIINDFAAIGHAVAGLDDSHFAHVCGPTGRVSRTGVTSIVGPGTGLGVAALLRRVDSYDVIATEGGHIDFAPLDPIEDHILHFLRRDFRRVSVERIVAGSGIVNIHNALAALEGRAVIQRDDKALWSAALDGSDSLAAAALDRYCLCLGAVAGDLALAHGAEAVVIAGGLGLRLKDHLSRSGFAGRFSAKGRFEHRMEEIPVTVVTHPQPGLFGAAAAFARAHP